MLIKVFGTGCSRCYETEAAISRAVKESGGDATIEKISDLKEIMAHGIMSTPAVSIDGKMVCAGHVPAKAEILEWLNGNRNCCSEKSGASGCSCGGKC